jgi:gliding motility-associated lipoprotein GldD
VKQAITISISLILLFTACEDPIYTPKPRAYPKVEYPEKNYQPFDKNYCSFTFEYPEYAVVEQDTAFFEGKPLDPCWFDLLIPAFDARVHCSYIPIDQNNPFDELNADAFDLANKHNLKANYIDDFIIQKPNGVSGIAFNLEGAVASPFQFILTDSTNHFLRGSLYFNTQARPDSLAPIIDFVKTDIMHMINTFAWEE